MPGSFLAWETDVALVHMESTDVVPRQHPQNVWAHVWPLPCPFPPVLVPTCPLSGLNCLL